MGTHFVTYYADGSAPLPRRVHLGRALGGPLANTVVGLLALIGWVILGGHVLLFFTTINLVLGIGILLPFPGVDGEVLWRELRR